MTTTTPPLDSLLAMSEALREDLANECQRSARVEAASCALLDRVRAIEERLLIPPRQSGNPSRRRAAAELRGARIEATKTLNGEAPHA